MRSASEARIASVNSPCCADCALGWRQPKPTEAAVTMAMQSPCRMEPKESACRILKQYVNLPAPFN